MIIPIKQQTVREQTRYNAVYRPLTWDIICSRGDFMAIADRKRAKDVLEMAVIMTEKENPTISEVSVYTPLAGRVVDNINDVLMQISTGEFKRNAKNRPSFREKLETWKKEAENV
jgi:hypothetical protein